MRLFEICLALALVSGFQVAAEEAEPPPPAEEAAARENTFDHRAHIGLKTGCDTCHVDEGPPEVRDKACSACHDEGDGVDLAD